MVLMACWYGLGSEGVFVVGLTKFRMVSVLGLDAVRM